MSGPIAVYPGSFDPWTLGHSDILERSLRLFPRVVVGLGVHPTRSPLFSADERIELLTQVCGAYPGVSIEKFDGLLVDFARSMGATVVVRGLRSAADFDYETQMTAANADLCPELDTVFLPAKVGHQFISASLVREVARHGADVSRYAPPPVVAALLRKYPR
jgi:pantetheine-phosphate adenylyltransferase